MKENIEDIYRVMDAIEKDQAMSQRELSKSLGYSLGKVNYILKGLMEKGLVKIENFARSSHKLRYAYVLTPNGIREKVKITRDYLKRRELEYERMRLEIEELKRKVGE